MQIEFTGRGTEVPEAIRSLAERKLGKLGQRLQIARAHVILIEDKHRQIAEVSIQSSSISLTAVEESSDFGVSVATVIDKLTRQAQRHLGKLRKRRAPLRATALWSGVLGAGTPATATEAKSGPRVIRSQRFVVKPMSVEEAATRVGSGEEEFLVFRDSATERVNVLFKRKDGNLGLIEPEA